MELLIEKFYPLAGILIVAGMAYYLKKIDLGGAVLGISFASIIYSGAGMIGLSALLIFFVLGSAATSWKKGIKHHYETAQENDGKRGISNVFANGIVAAGAAACSIFSPEQADKYLILVVASLAVACSDTLSSELGTVYGRKFVSIVNLKTAKRGTDGAISLEGLGFGIFGSLAVSFTFYVFYGNFKSFIIIAVCGFIGNIIDSVLGATYQRHGQMNNHQVNFLATLTGAAIALMFFI